MLHAAIPEAAVPPGALYRQWAGEGEWVFLSLSDPGDTRRAPPGVRVLSASAHTRLADWRGLSEEAYRSQKMAWQERMVRQVERLIPGFRESALCLLGATPRTYQFYTRRQDGWVGGYPQVHPLRTSSPKTPSPTSGGWGRASSQGSRCRLWPWVANGWPRWCLTDWALPSPRMPFSRGARLHRAATG